MNSELIPLMVVFPLISAIVLNVLHGKDKAVRYYGTAAMLVIIAIPMITIYGNHLFGAHPETATMPGTGIVIPYIDLAIEYSFSFLQRALVLLLAGIATFAVLIHSAGEEKASGAYLSMIMLSIAAVSAVAMANDIFNMFVFLEIAAISQAAIIITMGRPDAYKAAFKYLIYGGVAGASILVGIALLLGTFGVLNITDLHNALAGNMSNPVVLTAIGLLLVGWVFESGLFPFHTIKSNLYSSAKPDVGALLQTETKIVLIAIAVVLIRMFGGLSNMSSLMLALSLVTLVFGAIMALLQADFRRLVAFSAVSQAGLVGLSMGLGTEQGVSAGIFHAINDALAMSLIFITVYVIYDRAKTTEFSRLGGLLTKAPTLAFIQIIGILAVSGIPPFNAYQSEYRIIDATFNSGFPELGVIVILGTILTFVALMKGFYYTFLRENVTIAAKDRIYMTNTIPKATMLALLVLVVVCVGIGLFPALLYDRISEAATLIVGGW